MAITLGFKSVQTGQSLGQIDVAATPGPVIPIAGDRVAWVADGKAYQGLVQKRLISYSSPEMSVGRDDYADVTATLFVDVE